MNIILLFAVAISALGAVSANHRPTIQTLLYRPPPRPRPNWYRVRRQVSVNVDTNPQDAPNHNLIGKPGGHITKGIELGYNLNGHGAVISKTHTPGVGELSKIGARVNLKDSKNYHVDANVFKSNFHHVSGSKYDTRGVSLDYNHKAGHSASLGASRTNIPAFPNVNLGTKVEASGRGIVWSNKASSLGVDGTVSRMHGGNNHGAVNFGAGLSFNHRFRG